MTSENSTIDFHVTIYYHIKVVMPKVEKKITITLMCALLSIRFSEKKHGCYTR